MYEHTEIKVVHGGFALGLQTVAVNRGGRVVTLREIAGDEVGSLLQIDEDDDLLLGVGREFLLKWLQWSMSIQYTHW